MSSGDPETRKRILVEARRLIIENRGKDVRIEDIAQAAGVSRQAVYMHFGSRPGLLIATARYLDETLGLSERLQPVITQQNGMRELEAWVEFWGHYIPDIYGLAKALLSVRDSDDAAAAAWDDRMEAVYDGCLNTVRHLEKDGILAPEWTIETAADFFWATISIATWEHLTMECGWSQAEYIERIQRVLKRALLKTS